MKRADAQKALEDEAVLVLRAEYRNLLVTPLAADRPQRDAIREKFAAALRINLEALAIGSKSIAANPDLED